MRYKIPQFVDMEDRIIGPITMRQLAILGFGGGMAYAAYMRLDSPTWFFVAGPLGIGALVFAFVRVQDMSFFRYLLAMIQYVVKPEKRVWQQHADYIRPPRDLFENKKVKKENSHSKEDEELLKKTGDYAALFDGREDSLIFDSFHSDKKHDEISERFSKIKQMDTKSVQERVMQLKRKMGRNNIPVNHSTK